MPLPPKKPKPYEQMKRPNSRVAHICQSNLRCAKAGGLSLRPAWATWLDHVTNKAGTMAQT